MFDGVDDVVIVLDRDKLALKSELKRSYLCIAGQDRLQWDGWPEIVERRAHKAIVAINLGVSRNITDLRWKQATEGKPERDDCTQEMQENNG